MSYLPIINEQDTLNNVRVLLNNRRKDLMSIWNREEKVFKIKKHKLALIVVDMQEYYCHLGLKLNIDGFKSTIENINKLVDICHRLNIPVIWLRQHFNITDDYSDAGHYPVLHSQPVEPKLCNDHCETQVSHLLNKNTAIDIELKKNRYSAFINNSSELDKKLKELGKTQLLFTGVMLNVCVESSIRDAMQLNYEPVLISDATTAFDKILYEASLFNIQMFFGDVYTTGEINNLLQ